MLLLQEEINAYGIDWDGPLPDEVVDVPEVPELLDANQLQVLINSVDPLQRSEVYGIDLYVETKLFKCSFSFSILLNDVCLHC